MAKPAAYVMFSCEETIGIAIRITFQLKKPENGSLIRQKNTKERIVNHKGTRMVKDGED